MSNIEIYKEKRIAKFEPNELLKNLVSLINHCALISSQKIDDAFALVCAKELSEDIRKKHYSLSFSEIKHAFIEGVKGEYGEYYGLNVKSFSFFLRKYKESEERLKVQNERIKMKQLPVPVLSEQEKEQIIINGILEKFEDCKKKGFVQDLGNIAYKYLGSKGLLNISRDYKDDVRCRAELQMIKDASEKLINTFNVFERNILKDIIEDPAVKNDELQVLCMNIVLNDYFKGLIEKGIELKEILNNKS